jgi:integrase/recombinase XerD
LIDKAEQLTPSVIAALESLRHHFHFIVAARKVEIKHASWLTNFEKIELKPLKRSESMELIVRASEDFRTSIEDFEAFKNHIWHQTGGVPQYILEMIDRFRQEGFVSAAQVSSFNHMASRKEIDMSIVVLVGLSSLMVLRYVAGEIGGEDKDAFKLIGGCALLFALYGRYLFRATKRRYL